jgi:hypothetical protein
MSGGGTVSSSSPTRLPPPPPATAATAAPTPARSRLTPSPSSATAAGAGADSRPVQGDKQQQQVSHSQIQEADGIRKSGLVVAQIAGFNSVFLR